MQKINIEAFDLDNPNKVKTFSISPPNECPHCNKSIEPKHLSSFCRKIEPVDLYTSFLCPSCYKLFSVQYKLFQYTKNRTDHTIIILPQPNRSTYFSSVIGDISPNFVTIFNQSETAENYGLDKICGQGYRKALEFLIKDYAIEHNPNEKEKIQNMSVASCIDIYIQNTRIQTLAKASAWIGNDETHYVRKHVDYNLQDLKKFITSIVSYIELDYQISEAEKLLNGK